MHPRKVESYLKENAWRDQWQEDMISESGKYWMQNAAIVQNKILNLTGWYSYI